MGKINDDDNENENQPLAVASTCSSEGKRHEAQLTSSLTLALRKLMECRTPDGRYLVRHKYQWWAIYHVLVRFHRWPVGYHEFTERIAQLFPEGLRVPCTESTLKQLSQTRYMDALDTWRYDALYHGSPERFRLMRETVEFLIAQWK